MFRNAVAGSDLGAETTILRGFFWWFFVLQANFRTVN
jgi:hypothetical protein